MPSTPCPNASGECVTPGCSSDQSTIWYGKKGSKYCKHCYDTIPNKKKRTRSVLEEEEEENPAGDVLVEIKSIYGLRRVPALEPAPPHVHAPFSNHSPRVPVRCGRFCKQPRCPKERSNPVAEEDKTLEYDVYGWWRFEDDATGVRRLGRQWTPIEEVAAVAGGWSDEADALDEAVVDARAAFE